MAVKFTNNARTTLAADITNSATTATVTSGAVFPELNAGEYFYCTFDNGTNNEIVKVTARSGNTLTIVRGVDNSTARAFVADDAAELRATAGLLTDIQENLAAKSANQTIYNATTASNATAYDIGIDPGQESNAMVFLNGVMQHHDTFSFSSSTLTFDTAPVNGTALEVIVDNLINLQSSNLTTDTFTATSGQTAFVLSDAPAAENNLIVFIDGVFQDQSNYSISDHTLTLATGAVQGRTVTIYIINPVNIGTPSDGTVTTSKLSGNITMPGTLTVGAFDVAFDSPTFFVDNSNSRVGLGTATPSVPVDIVGEVKISSHLNMPDNAIAKFGTDSDLQIYHDGSHSYVSDQGTGSLLLRGSAGVYLQNAGGTENMVAATADGAVTLYHNNAAKLATTSTGIDVTGVVTGTEFNVGVNYAGKFNAKQSNADAYGIVLEASANDRWLRMGHNGTTGQIDVTFNASGGHSPLEFLAGGSERLHIDTNGKIYMNEGVPFSWTDSSHNVSAEIYGDSSDNLVFRNTASKTERMRIGSTGKITTRGTTASGYGVLEFGTININTNLSDGVVDFAQGLAFTNNVTNEGAWTQAGICATGSSGYNGNLVFGTDGNSSRTSNTITERMRINSSGNVGIGNSGVASTRLAVTNSVVGVNIETTSSNAGHEALIINRQSSDGIAIAINKAGSTVGSIGTANGDLHIDGLANHSGIRFQAGSLLPRLNGSDTNGTI